jgi:hypothetical protein
MLSLYQYCINKRNIMPEEPMENEQQSEPTPQVAQVSGFGGSEASESPEMESFTAEPEMEPAAPPAPVPQPMTGTNIDGIQNAPEPTIPTMAPESLPVQSAPMNEPVTTPVVVTGKKSKMTMYLIIAIIVVVLLTAAYFAYQYII